MLRVAGRVRGWESRARRVTPCHCHGATCHGPSPVAVTAWHCDVTVTVAIRVAADGAMNYAANIGMHHFNWLTNN